MNVIKFLVELKELNVFVNLVEGKLSVKGDRAAITSTIKQQLGSFKQSILDSYDAFNINSNRQLAPASFAQQRLWFIDYLQGNSANYNMPMAMKVNGKFNTEVAQQALMRIVGRHAVLRTSYRSDDSGAFQVIRDNVIVAINERDLTGLGGEQQALMVQRFVDEDVSTPFDLTQDVMLRTSWLALDNTPEAEQGVLLFNMHHIASDGWSMGILIQEFVQQYKALLAGQPDPLAPLAIQYYDYAHWQHDHLKGEVLEAKLDYWTTHLADAPVVHSLPLDFERPAQMQTDGEVVSAMLPAKMAKKVTELAQQLKVTPFMIMHGALSQLLSYHSNSDDILVGVPVANRLRAELEPLIGFFVNTLVLRTDSGAGDTFVDYLKHVKQVNLDAQAHQDIPFEQLVEHLKVPRSTAHTPLFQIMFSMDTTAQSSTSMDGLDFTPLSSNVVQVKFDLTLNMMLSDDGISINWLFDKSLFKTATIARLNQHLMNMATALIEQPQAPLKGLSVLSEQEHFYLTQTVNDHNTAQVQNKTIHQLFDEQAKRTPQCTAITFGASTVNYADLNQRANQLAHWLQSKGVIVETLVGISMARSIDMVVAVLAVLKAGGAYVPLDPAYPQARLDRVIKGSQLPILLTQSDLHSRFDTQSINCICVDAIADVLKEQDKQTPVIIDQTPANLSYVIYTSGSTGEPKGVEISHANVAALLAWAEQTYSSAQLSRVLFSTSLNFDLSAFEMFVPLTLGHQVVLVENAMSLTTQSVDVSLINTVPSAARALLAADAIPANAQVINLAGEPLPQALVNQLLALPGCNKVFNLYGPSEDTTYSTFASFEQPIDDTPPIGRCIANTQAYVLSPTGVLVPKGCVGELYLAGAGVARGYLGQPQMTAERFIDNPFGDGLMYRTGDLVRYLDDDNLVYISRGDGQVKIRGFRIELGEIEHQLNKAKHVQTGVVLAREYQPGEKRLVAYIKLNESLDDDQMSSIKEDIKTQIKAQLPEYMVPSILIVLDEMPLTANGKINKKALPAPDAALMCEQFIAPCGQTQIQLADIWADLLKLEVEQVSATANFFELGGHSLLSLRLLAQIRSEFEVELVVRDVFEYPVLSQMAQAIENNHGSIVRPPVLALPREGDLMPASFAQQRLWFIDQIEGGSAHYNMPLAFSIKGVFDETIAEQAFTAIVARHETLRTVYQGTADQVWQRINKTFEFTLGRGDISLLDEQEQAHMVQQAITTEFSKPFDLHNDLMLRANYIRLSEREGVLMCNMHHIASDGWSMGILMSEFVRQYQAISQGEPSPLAPLDIQYADYAKWQQDWLQGDVLAGQLDYWQNQLAELPQVHSLPLDRPRPAVQSFNGAMHTFRVDETVLSGLQSLASVHNATLFMVLHSVFSLLLSRYSNSNDIVIGTPVANRLQHELEPLVGFFVNTLILRTNSADNQSFVEYLNQVKQVNLDAQSHQDVSFEFLVERLNPARSTSHNALFQVMFNFNNVQTSDQVFNELAITPLESDQVTAKFELTLNAIVREGVLSFGFEYNSDLFDASSIENIAKSLVALLQNVVKDPQTRVHQLPMLSTAQQNYLLNDLNDSQSKDEAVSIVQLFEQQVLAHPDTLAVVFEEQSLTYAQLNQKANQLAHYLIEQGVGKDTLVGLCVERSVEMIIGMFGIIKAGGAYVPLDPDYPQQRLAYMVQDSGIQLVISQSYLTERVEEAPVMLVALDQFDWQQSVFANPPTPSEDSLAYVIYTSGSTGQPKGVMIEHRNVVNLFTDFQRRKPVSGHQHGMLWATYSFDVSIYEIFNNLMFGDTLHIVPKDARIDPVALFDWMAQQHINQSYLPPFFLKELNAFLRSGNSLPLTQLLVGVEPIDESLLVSIRSQIKGLQIINGYGPTEATVCSTLFDVSDAGSVNRTTPIGRPVANVTHYVLGEHGQLLPAGAAGQLYIGGAGLGRGYLNRPEQSASAFVDHPFSQGEKLYKTGDLVRYLPDGNIMFVGRADDQVKIRGFRIELGEIEHQLKMLSTVKTAVVLAREDTPGEKYLVAYVVTSSEKVSDIRASLHQELPAHMVPSAFVVLDEMPLTPNGKVDKKALPQPDGTQLGGQYVAPVTDTEHQLVAIWAQLLKLDSDNISTTANFFELGGHSLLSLRLVAQVRSTFEVELAVTDIFDATSLAMLCEVIENNKGKTVRPEVVVMTRESELLPASFAQQRLWFIDQMDGGSAHYNMPMAMTMEGEFDPNIAEQAFASIVERHETLRTLYYSDGQQVWQIVQPEFTFKLAVTDIGLLDESEQQMLVQQTVNEEFATPFDLQHDLMLRASFIRLGTKKSVLLCNMHHIASDGWSMGILMSEFIQQYQSFAHQLPSTLAPLSIQYADYAAWQRHWLEGDVMEAQLAYWQQQLADLPQVHSLGLDRPRPAVQTFNGGSHSFTLSKDKLDSLNKLAQSNQATLFMVLHSAFSILLARYANNDDIVIGTPVANRLQRELEPLVGFFVNTLILRTNSAKNASFNDYLKQVRRVNLDAQSNQDVPFESLVERLQPARNTSHSPLFQIMFSLNNNETSGDSFSELNITPMGSDQITAKFELNLDATETEQGMEFALVYNTDLFDDSTIARMTKHFEQLLASIIASPESLIYDLPMLSADDKDYLNQGLNSDFNLNLNSDLNPEPNNSPMDRSQGHMLHQLFETQAQLRPDEVAVVFGDEQLSYGELNNQANQLAHYLIEQGVQSGTLVGLCVERNTQMIVAVLAILKAGGAYVPLDPEYPQSRLDYMINDSGIKLLITQSSHAHPNPNESASVTVLQLDDKQLQQSLQLCQLCNPANNTRQNASDLAYVMYTSGSTGEPKGVMISHNNVVSYYDAVQQHYHISEADTVLQFSSISFDIFVEEMFTSLLSGAALVLRNEALMQGGEVFWQFIRQNRISVMSLPTAYWHMLAAQLSCQALVSELDLRLLIVGGEKISVAMLARWQQYLPESIRLYNTYGPTEMTVIATAYDATDYRRKDREVPIGRPLANTKAYIFDQTGQHVPYGAVGELYLGGESIARGYLNRPELTCERFIENGDERLYKTGDLVRYLADTNIEFIGRADDQVKIRGFRIELGEIEYQLAQLAGVESAMVLVHQDEDEQLSLVAYVIGQLQPLEIRQGLQSTLPSYMTPQSVVLIEQWPMTPNGKVDKKALPAPDGSSMKTQYVAPAGQIQSELAVIWANLLKCEISSVSANGNFFELGGHSLLSMRLVAAVREQFGAELPVKTIFDTQTLAELALEISAVQGLETRSQVVAMPRDGRAIVASFAQQRLWFIDQMEGSSAHYNMPMAMQINGVFDENAAEKVFEQLITRHEALRTVYVGEQDQAMQIIRDEFEFSMARYDLSDKDAATQQALLMEILTQDAVNPFDLGNDLMFRAAFVRINPAQGVLLFNMHHIASDGWSMSILTREFIQLYQACIQGQPMLLAPLDIQYADYALWQREWLAGDVLETQLSYWEQQLADLPQVHELRLDNARAPIQSFNGAVHSFSIDANMADDLKALALSNNATLFMVLHGVFGLLLARHSNIDDIVIGTPVANRMQKELESTVGFFVNTLVLRTNSNNNPSFNDYLSDVRQVNLDAQSNQDVTFDFLVERLQPPRSTAHSPLFQILFSMDTNEVVEESLQEVGFVPLGSDHITAKYELTLNATEIAGNSAPDSERGIEFGFNYNRDLFNADTIQTLGEHFIRLLSGILNEPTCPVQQLPLLALDEQKVLLEQRNDTAVDFGKGQLMHQMFGQSAAAHPHNVALKMAGEQLNYGELEIKANQLANYLIAQGLQPNSLVGLCIERSIDMVVAILAILKAGSAYVPMEPGYPQARLDHVVKDSALDLIVTQSHLVGLFDVNCVAMDSLQGELADACVYPPVIVEQSDNALAYVIYTSGSTGQPKGVMIEHRSVVNLANSLDGLTLAQDGQSWGWMASVVFDSSIKGLTRLLKGQPLAILSETQKQDVTALKQQVQQDNIGVLDCTPSLLELWLSQHGGEFLPNLVIGGEAITPALWQTLVNFQNNTGHLAYNVYGPTECTVNSSWTLIEGEQANIGTMLPNTQGYILNDAQQLVPQGGVGELYVGGAGLARGYLNQPQLTAECFADITLADGISRRLYRTGDRVRFLPQGQIAYLGRADDQVKIRGYRVELDEISHQLSTCEQIESAVVIVAGSSALAAYVTLREAAIDEAKIKAQLMAQMAAKLPAYMVPAIWVILDNMPLTVNGKVDKKALPALDSAMLGGAYVAPQGEIETQLAQIWANLLKLDVAAISARANFFELGGHSLLSLRLVAQVRTRLKVELSVRDIFDATQLSQLAQTISNNQDVLVRPGIVAKPRQSNTLPSSFAQQRLWFIDQMEGGSVHYNMPMAMRIEGAFIEAVAEQAFSTIIERHEPLRTVFKGKSNDKSKGNDEQVWQYIQPHFEFKMGRQDLSMLTEIEQLALVDQLAAQSATEPFNLSEDLMLRASFIRLSDNEGILLCNMHHIASDGWSMGLLTSEFVQQYRAISQGLPNPLAPLAIQYADYAQWQREWLEGEVLAGQLDYWQQHLADLPQVHSLPLDRPRTNIQTFNGAMHSFSADKTMLDGLNSLALEHNATLFMVLHSAFSLLLSRFSNSHDIVVGTPVANRLQQELEPLVGFFVNTLILRTSTQDNPAFGDYLEQVKQVNLDAQSHQDIPFEYLVEQINPGRSTSHSPLFQVMFAMNNTEASEQALSDLRFTPFGSADVTAKFELTLNASQSEDQLAFAFEYNTDLFDASTIEQLSTHLLHLLGSIVTTPQCPIHQLPLMTQSAIEWADEPVVQAQDHAQGQAQSLNQLFETQAQSTPDNLAIVCGDRQVSYRELNQKANQLAHGLIAQGVKPDTLVGLCFERSIDMMVGVLAILKAGGAYVPLDPNYPVQRLEHMVNDSCINWLLTENDTSKVIDQSGLTTVALNDFEWSSHVNSNPVLAQSEHDLAYMIYTSGSTGLPKGVMIEHKGAVNLAHYQRDAFVLNSHSRVLQFASLNFDAATTEWMMALTTGASLLVCSNEQRHSPELLQLYMLEQQVTHAVLTPGVLRHLSVYEDYTLQCLIVGGEACEQSLADKWSARFNMINGYGPTEITVMSSTSKLSPGTPVSIGHALPNTQSLVLNHYGELQPFGAIGELHIGGVGLARGYHNQPELTEQRFIEFGQGQKRLYKTGDLVRQSADGQLSYHGRTDDQVKIRGSRIELGEIEHQLQLLNKVDSAVVMVQDDQNGEKQLVAYVASEQLLETVTLRERLQSALPDYMVPSTFIVLAEMPLTANGKVDKKALPSADLSSQIMEYVAPVTQTEQMMQSIWQQLLDCQQLSITVNFFAAGGHSLMIMALLSKVNQQFNVTLTINDIFAAQTVQQLSQQVDNQAYNNETANTEGANSEGVVKGLVQLKASDKTVPPLFVVHPVGGQVLNYRQMVEAMDYPGAVYGLEAQNTQNKDIQSMAAHYLTLIKKVQASGAYHLAGWSMGGVIATEMAYQLKAGGDRIGALIMMDSHTPQMVAKLHGKEVQTDRQIIMTIAAELAIDVSGLANSQLESMTTAQLLLQLLALGHQQSRLPLEFDIEQLSHRFELLKHNETLFMQYQPKALDETVHLVRASHGQVSNSLLGWDGLFTDLNTTTVEGDHFSIMRQPDVNGLAAKVDLILTSILASSMTDFVTGSLWENAAA